VHLVAEGERIVAFFPGGASGDRLLTRDVTTVGQWGQTPSASKDLGALSENELIVIDAKGRR
jgi:phage FluMu protein gp41